MRLRSRCDGFGIAIAACLAACSSETKCPAQKAQADSGTFYCSSDDDCPETGSECTKGVCGPWNTCDETVAPGFCRIDGMCSKVGQRFALNDCLACNPEISQTGWTVVTCADQNPCTRDFCDVLLGCVFVRDDTLTCDDGKECSTGDHCAQGACVGTGCGDPPPPPPGECGDGDLNDGEECDEGEANSDAGACTKGCKKAKCGDGLLHAGVEKCDGDSFENGVCDGQCSGILCEPNHGDCNGGLGDGCEQDLLGSAEHCGICWYDCAGGGCAIGKCAPTLVSSGAPDSFDILVHGGYVYWSGGGSGDGVLQRAALGSSGAVPAKLAEGEAHPRGLSARGSWLYWANAIAGIPYPGAVKRVPLEGGEVQTISSGHTTPQDTEVDDTHVYFVVVHDGTVERVPVDGSAAAEPLAEGLVEPHTLAMDAGSLYVAERSDKQRILRIAKDGSGQPVTVAKNQGTPWRIALDEAAVYWTSRDTGFINRAPKDGGPIKPLAGEQNEPRGLAVDATHVYWVSSAGGQLTRVATSGTGGVQVLAEGLDTPTDAGVDEEGVYWTLAKGAVYRLPKPPAE